MLVNLFLGQFVYSGFITYFHADGHQLLWGMKRIVRRLAYEDQYFSIIRDIKSCERKGRAKIIQSTAIEIRLTLPLKLLPAGLNFLLHQKFIKFGV